MLTASPVHNPAPDLIYLGPGVSPAGIDVLTGSLRYPLTPAAKRAFRALGLAGVPGWVYTIHLLEPLGDAKNPRNAAWHYTGFTTDLEGRIAGHAAGLGSRILEVARERHIRWVVVAVYPGTHAIETEVKQQTAARRCPVCTSRPRIPLSVRALAAEIGRQPGQRQGHRDRPAAKWPQRPFMTGVARGDEWCRQMLSTGTGADQIEVLLEAQMAASPAPANPWQATHLDGYQAAVRSHLKAVRRAARQPQKIAS